MNSKFKLWLLIIIVVVLGLVGLYYFQDESTKALNNEVANESSVIEYDDLLSEVMQRKLDASNVEVGQITQESAMSIDNMLRAGIRTSAGIVRTDTINTQMLPQYTIKINDTVTAIKSVVPIRLTKAFLIESEQILIFAIGPGDNNCDTQYQIFTVHGVKYKVSKVFGTCLPLTLVTESNNQLEIKIPQSNPYLGDEVNYTYLYKNGEVKLVSQPTKKEIKKSLSKSTAKAIIDLAKQNGCYQDGVMLDNVSCGGGKRYCSMFKNLKSTAKHDNNYAILKDFCE